MACPFFEPKEVLAKDWGLHRPRTPLGQVYSGRCHAGDDYLPSERELIDWCNWGYARGACPRFPESAPADALRFSINADGVVAMVAELEFAPVPHATLDQRCIDAQHRAFQQNH